MATALKVWDASGNLILDVTDRITRILGYTTLPASSSNALTDAGFSTGTPFFIAIRSNGTGTAFNGAAVAVDISFSGNTMYYSTSQSVADFIIVYGVY